MAPLAPWGPTPATGSWSDRKATGSRDVRTARRCRRGNGRAVWPVVEARVPIGEVLAAARRRAGLSVAQVSERTRIRETTISSIESGDYSACGGDFYARGHIRAMARAVGADAEPLIREYDSLHRAPGAVSAVSLEELLSTSAPVPRRRPGPPVVVGLVAAAWAAAWRRSNLATIRDLAAQAYRSPGRRVNWKPAFVLALVVVVAGFGLYRLLSGVPQRAAAPPPAAQAAQAYQQARPDRVFQARQAAPGAARSRPGAHSQPTLRRPVLAAAIPVRSHDGRRSRRQRQAHRPGTQRPPRRAGPRHGHPHRHGHRDGHGHGHRDGHGAAHGHGPRRHGHHDPDHPSSWSLRHLAP